MSDKPNDDLFPPRLWLRNSGSELGFDNAPEIPGRVEYLRADTTVQRERKMFERIAELEREACRFYHADGTFEELESPEAAKRLAECDELYAQCNRLESVVRKMVGAMYDYQMHVDEPAPLTHRNMMLEAEAALEATGGNQLARRDKLVAADALEMAAAELGAHNAMSISEMHPNPWADFLSGKAARLRREAESEGVK